jgi:endonuclease/exonuclease/phosphatase family metal-dependent hydrolase
MKNASIKTNSLFFICLLFSGMIYGQSGPIFHFDFENTIKSDGNEFNGKGYSFVKGIHGKALNFDANSGYNNLSLDGVSMDGTKDFSIQCWIKTSSKNPTVFLSQKNFDNKGISTQEHVGWALYSSGGTFAGTLGSGEVRMNYERGNGKISPINDGEWHQLVITFSKEHSDFRLYYDGHNKAIYNVGFDFSNKEPLKIGAIGNNFDYANQYLPEIMRGQRQLQAVVDEFNKIGLEPLKNDEFIDFISNTERIFEQKQEKLVERKETFHKELISKTLLIREKLLDNPYTVYQIRDLTILKPISKIYALKAGKIVINDDKARFFTKNEKLFPSDFAMDQLVIWDRSISSEEVLELYNTFKNDDPFRLSKNLKNINIGVWNIWNGGLHWSIEEDGWDSRMRIAEMIREKHIDVVLMQETYSAGDFISAELGYYFATTSDQDYRYQGSNISVLSRYPIKEIKVLTETAYNNVAVKLAISETQEIWAISNWYGMSQFPAVFDFHKLRFENTHHIPVLFGGDFNAIPHRDGGKSMASEMMIAAGFTDAYRNLYPDISKYPGPTHRRGSRIDQLYYMGKGLKNNKTEVISSWPGGFPSDHFLILSKFKLKY